IYSTKPSSAYNKRPQKNASANGKGVDDHY
ncbi:hypothetical protein SSYM_1430, partial [Serratia symbiotica str. Tucson]